MRSSYWMVFFCGIMSLGIIPSSKALDVQLKGTMADTAFILVDGNSHTLKMGKTSPQGIKLLAINGSEATISYMGKTQQLITGLGSNLNENGNISSGDANHQGLVAKSIEVETKPTMIDDSSQGTEEVITNDELKVANPKEVVIPKNNNGHFEIVGSINGQNVSFMVDTGASMVAMPPSVAKRLGIDYRVVGKEGRTNTANGIARSWLVKLKSVKVGHIQLNDVDGSVAEGFQGDQVLLGMSFMNRLNWQQSQGSLYIRTKY